MSKPPTISLPFTTYDTTPTKPSWYHIFAGSRLRNRALAFIASLSLFLFCIVLLRGTAYGTSADERALGPANGVLTSSSAAHVYAGADATLSNHENLVIVAGHAIWLGGQSYRNDSDWFLEPHQVGQTSTFLDHIRKGAEVAHQLPNALLIFSGGNTRLQAGARTESQSYAALLERLMKDDPAIPSVPMTTEEFARDSYENLIFSIARAFEVTGRYPRTISVIGFGFKEDRFLHIHRKAIGFPMDRFTYYGIDPEGLDEVGMAGEISNAKALFEKDLYGCKSAVLLDKKKMRNPFRRRHGYELSNPQLAELLDYCPREGDQPYTGKLPWT